MLLQFLKCLIFVFFITITTRRLLCSSFLVLSLHSSRSTTTERTSEGEVDVLLWVDSHHEGWHINNLSPNPVKNERKTDHPKNSIENVQILNLTSGKAKNSWNWKIDLSVNISSNWNKLSFRNMLWNYAERDPLLYFRYWRLNEF